MVANQNKYTDEYKRETADYIISTGRPIAEVCREFGISDKTAGRWVKDRRRQLSGEPDPKAGDAEVAALRRRNRELEMENAFLKKAAAFFAREQA